MIFNFDKSLITSLFKLIPAMFRGILFGLLTLLASGAYSAQQIHSLENGRLIWTLETPGSSQRTISPSGIAFEGWNSTINDQGLNLPVSSKLIFTRSGAPHIDIETLDSETIPVLNPIAQDHESAKGLDLILTPVSMNNEGFVSLKHIRDEVGFEVWAINVWGAVFDAGSSSWIQPHEIRLTVDPHLPSSVLLTPGDLYLNRQPMTEAVQVSSVFEAAGKMKLYVLQDGIYRISYELLAEDPDFPTEIIESQSLQLSNLGEAQPIHVHDGGDGRFDSGDYFDFIGKQHYFSGSTQYFDPYSDINVYWLDWGHGNGLRFVEESGALNAQNPVRPTSFWDTQHIENDFIFDRLGQVDTDLPTITRDHYFWSSVNSGQWEEAAFFLADPARGSSENLQISIGLHGLTYSESGSAAAHQLFAYVNQQSVGSASWVQQEAYVLESPSSLNLSHSILSASGNNVLAISAPVSSQAGNYDRIVLNWLEISYEHLLTAHDNALKFRKSFINPSTTLEFEITGFTSSDFVLYKEGLSKITSYTIRENLDNAQAEYSIVFQDNANDATPDYWVASTERLLQPIKIAVDTLADLRHLDGDFIIITTPELLAGLDEYLAFKELEGWQPVAVSAEDIYDEFNAGLASPWAIKSFLTYAHSNWASTPEYVMLVGDATSNPGQTKRDTRIRHIPTFYMQTYGWGAAEADFWYSLIEGNDYLPDIHIGRLPVSTLASLEMTLNKLIGYGSGENYGAWQNEIVTIAGFETTFKSQSESLLRNNVPQTYMPSRVFVDRDSEGQIFWGDTDSLVDLWNDGKMLINFLGHGGGAVWADRSLFVRDDIRYLQPATPPAFITSMTCFTGSFAQVGGLGEVVLTESPTGAIGWFGSSGVGWLINDYLMIQPLISRLLTEHEPVGKLINQARMEYYIANSGYDYLKASMLFQYNFLGDPTTRLLLPEASEHMESAEDIYAADDQISLHYSGSEDVTLRLLPVDAYNHPWWAAPQSYQTALTSDFLISQADGAPSGLSRTIYTLDRGPSTTAMQGAVIYSINTDWFEHSPPTAAALSQGGPLGIAVQYHNNIEQADSLSISFYGGHSAAFPMIWNSGTWVLSDSVHFSPVSPRTNYYFSAWHGGSLLATSSSYVLQLPKLISLTINDLSPAAIPSGCGVSIAYTLSGAETVIGHIDVQTRLGQYHHQVAWDVQLTEGQHSIWVPALFSEDTLYISGELSLNDYPSLGPVVFSDQLTSNLRQVVPDIGISFSGVSEDSIKIWGKYALTATSQDSAWVEVKVDPSPSLPGSGVTLYADSVIYLIQRSSTDVQLNAHIDQTLFFKDFRMPVWEKLVGSDGSIQITGDGAIGLGVQQDFTPPEVSMTVEGQLFFDGDYLLENSRMNLLAEDPTGFSWKTKDVYITVDGSPVAVTLGDTTQSAQIISITAALDLSIGHHTMLYKVSDALGNWSDPVSMVGVVAGEAEIIDYGNYPNPFAGETLIIYELTKPLDDLVIEIFTLSGFKIHSIDLFNARVGIALGASGYHEVPWNGRDRNEDFVANGVYFYRIRGKQGGDELTGHVGKMVKNR